MIGSGSGTMICSGRDGYNRGTGRDGYNKTGGRDGYNRKGGRDGYNKTGGRDGYNRIARMSSFQHFKKTFSRGRYLIDGVRSSAAFPQASTKHSMDSEFLNFAF
jgi:hypothetical protein